MFRELLTLAVVVAVLFLVVLRAIGLNSWRSALRTAALAFLAVVAIGFMAGCTITQTVGAPTPVPSPSPTPTPRPSASPGGSGAMRPWRVNVVFNGEEVCDPGTSADTGDRRFRVGCDQAFTCTPKLLNPDGTTRDASPEEVGEAPAVFGVEGTPTASFGPPGYIRQESNRYNIHAKAVSPGRLDLLCVVNGIEGRNSYAVVS